MRCSHSTTLECLSVSRCHRSSDNVYLTTVLVQDRRQYIMDEIFCRDTVLQYFVENHVWLTHIADLIHAPEPAIEFTRAQHCKSMEQNTTIRGSRVASEHFK